VLKPGRKPSEAIDAMFANLAQWRLDCAQYVQIAELYALRHTRGAEAFDSEHHGASFEFKPLDSTDKLFYRSSPDEPMQLMRGTGSPATSADEVVANAPIGSRVGWRNLAAPTSSAYYNENTIKLGPDEFAAHGFGEPWRFTRQEIVQKLAEMTLGRPVEPERDVDYIADNVFVVEVQYFKIP
jgi:protein-glutamine gamma-glutamyltransferase-like protein